MSWAVRFRHYCQRLMHRQRIEEELDDEVQAYFEVLNERHVARGLSREEARRAARVENEGPEQVKEKVRDARMGTTLETTFRDLHYACRVLAKSPGFTVIAVLTLALGIGANTAIFQLLDAVRLRSLPVPNPQQLSRIRIRNGNGGFGITPDAYNLSYPLLQELRRNQEAFSGVFGWSHDEMRFGRGAHARHVKALVVSGDFFPTLQVTPAAGRLFRPDDDQRGCTAPGVVLSYAFWQSEFAGRTSAIGNKVIIHDQLFEVIGVTPPRFSGLEVGEKFDVAAPMCVAARFDLGSFTRADYFWVTVMGRLKPGMSFGRASDQLQAISPGLLEATLPSGYSAQAVENYKRFRLEAAPAANGISSLRDQYDTSLWLLLGITGLVLLIACANLGNLMLARAGARQREFAVRLALGASRLRLIRQSLCDSLMLALTGAAAGLALAGALSKTILWFLTVDNDSPQLDLGIDWRVLAFTAAVATLACVIFGLVPAVRASQTNPGAAIKSGGRLTEGRERYAFQRCLVVVQISVSLVLVVGALLFVESFRNLMALDPGFRAEGILLAFFDMSHLRLPDAEIKPFHRQLLEQVRSMPEVKGAAVTTTLLIGGGSWTLGIHAGSIDDAAKFTWVSPGYFHTLETPVLAGRDFHVNDTETSPKVAIVNQTFARRFFAGANPIGKTLRTAPEPNYPATEYQIIGVIKDTRYYNLRDQPPAMCYAPADQFPAQRLWTTMYIRSSAPLAVVSSAIQRRLSASHPELAVEFLDFQKRIEETLVRERLMAALSGFFGALAVLLSTIGLYGVIAYIVVRRRNEIGIRMALGATRGQIVGLVLMETAVLVAIGVAIGVACSLALVRTTSSLLFGLKASDPLTFFAAALLLAAIATLGSYVPARRASRLDPIHALRYD